MKPIRLVQIVGARPQFIKLAPVSRSIAELGDPNVEELIVHTGQHYDPQMSDVFFNELKIPRPAANLEVGSGQHGRQTAAMLERIEAFLITARPNAVIVYGDTNSTLAGALCAAKLQIPVAHIEAGLRSYNRAMPEELNRIATDHLSDLLLAPTDASMKNLAREGLGGRSHLVGDVMYDAVLSNAATARRESRILNMLGIEPASYGLVTVHRAENTHGPVLADILELLGRVIDSGLRLVFPLHPRTRESIQKNLPRWRPPTSLMMTEPLGSIDMLRLTEAAAVVLTDSGGLQKEAFMLGCPCVTLRSETEWVETVNAHANTLVGHDANAALAAVRQALDRGARMRETAVQSAHKLYGRGKAATRCVAEVLRLAGATG